VPIVGGFSAVSADAVEARPTKLSVSCASPARAASRIAQSTTSARGSAAAVPAPPSVTLQSPSAFTQKPSQASNSFATFSARMSDTSV